MNAVLERVVRELAALPEGEQARIARVLEDQVRLARRGRPVRRWAAVADRLAALDVLEGQSEGLVRHVRSMRDSVELGDEPPG